MIGFFAAGLIAPFFFEASPEVRSTYVSLGRIVEDRPMQVTFTRVGVDAGAFGRFGIRNWDVSSLTDRRHDAHRHALYHTEFGPTWQYDLDIADDWRLKSDLTRSWTMYRGFAEGSDNKTYHWWQLGQSLENPYLVPFWRFRRTFRGSDYFYFKAGVRRKVDVWDALSLTPSVFAEGGNARNQLRVLGRRPGDGHWDAGAASVSCRLEAAWRFCENVSAFAFVEQYEIVGGNERRAVRASSYRCAHNDWTLAGVGIRLKF